MRVLFSFLTLAFCISCCFCGEHPDGESKVSRSQDALGNYHFKYNVANGEGEQFREEGADALGRVIGSYGLTHVDGTHRVVDYIADKDGFRASVRSNEPGLISAEAADASIVKTDNNVPLSVAATSDDRSGQIFGRRINADASRVEYVGGDEGSKSNTGTDELARESRQRNFDDYRPLNPVAYYPTDTRRPLGSPAVKSVETGRSPRVLQSQNSEADSKPLDVYLPPINPHTAVRRPPYYLPRDRSTDDNFFPTTTSRKPYIPPYGGFDDDEEPVLPLGRRPDVGIRSSGPDYSISTPTPLLAHEERRFPPISTSERRNFDLPRFPPNSGHPRPPVLPRYPQDNPQGVLFNPPSYDGRIGSPNVVLKAVPIPNGIQAVRVDPNTGQVYERLVYPLFLRHDGHPEYDRNILLHNDDVSDDDAVRHDDPGYLDMPYIRRPFRGARDQPPTGEESDRARNGQRNKSYTIDEHSLSVPTAADLSWIKKQLSLVEGFDREHFSGGLLPNRFPHHDTDFPRDDYFDGRTRPQYERRNPGSRIRPNSDLLSYSSETGSARDERNHGDLTREGSRAVLSKLQESDGNSEKTEDKSTSELKTK